MWPRPTGGYQNFGLQQGFWHYLTPGSQASPYRVTAIQHRRFPTVDGSFLYQLSTQLLCDGIVVNLEYIYYAKCTNTHKYFTPGHYNSRPGKTSSDTDFLWLKSCPCPIFSVPTRCVQSSRWVTHIYKACNSVHYSYSITVHATWPRCWDATKTHPRGTK